MFLFKLSLLLYVIGHYTHFTNAFLSIVFRCGDPPVVNNSNIRYDGVQGIGGYNVTYVCQNGYHIIGPSDSIECLCTGYINCSFKGPLPICEPDNRCVKLPHPPHGQVRKNDNLTVNYSCNKGFILIGPSKRHCQENGRWSGKEPRCEAVPKPSALRCRACERVKHLDQCNRIITCSDDEECFTEHIINDITRLSVFTSGCRRKANCFVPSNISSGSDVVNCSGCCDDRNSPLGCNGDLCSFREKSGSQSTYCLQCELENSFDDCNNITACDSTQMCISRTIMAGSDHKVTAGCYSATTCLSLIKTLIESKNPRSLTRKYQRDIIHSCDICCGDHGCNNDSCEHVKERLAYLYQRGELNLQTLKANGTSSLF